MRKSRYSESQIIEIIHEGESGVPITDICRGRQISPFYLYIWWFFY